MISYYLDGCAILVMLLLLNGHTEVNMDSNLRLKTKLALKENEHWDFVAKTIQDNVTVVQKAVVLVYSKQWQQVIVEICKFGFPLLHLGMPSMKSWQPCEVWGNRALMESPPLSKERCPSNLELPVMICLTWLYRD